MYERLFWKVFYPGYETLLRRRHTLHYRAEYIRQQWYSEDQLQALQWNKLRHLLEHCQTHVPYYRRLFADMGCDWRDIKSMEDYNGIPVLTKDVIRDNYDDLVATPLRGTNLRKTTGGSTGVPLTLEYTEESYQRRMAVAMRGYGWAGANHGRRSVYLWGVALGEQPWKSAIKDRLYKAFLRQKHLNVFGLTTDNIDQYVDEISHFRPEWMAGYVAPLYTVAKHILDSGRAVHHPDAVIAAAEPVHDFQREAIEQAFGCPLFNTYGCREFMLIASECDRHTGLHANVDHLVVEVLDSEGRALRDESGDITLTDLHNFGMPFIRYQLGDRGTWSGKQCDCGRGLPLMKSIDGRRLDVIRTVDGRIVPGEFFPHLLKDVVGLEAFQVRQSALDRLEVLVVRGDEFTDDSMSFATKTIGETLGDTMNIDVQFVDEIPLTKSGKRRVTISEIAEQ